MMYFSYGPDTYRALQYAHQTADEFLRGDPHGLSILDLADTKNHPKLSDILKTESLFSTPRAVIIQNMLRTKNPLDLLTIFETCGTIQDQSVCVVLIEDIATKELGKKAQPLESFLAKHKIPRSYHGILSGNSLTDWIRQEVATRGEHIDTAATNELVRLVGDDTWALNQEVQKLCNFCSGSPITMSAVATLVSCQPVLSIFELTDALANKNQPHALELLFQHLASGQDPYYLLSMFTYQFRNLLVAKELGSSSDKSASALGIHPYVLRKALAQAQKYPRDTLLAQYKKLLALDTGAKRGLVNLADELYRFVIN